jgi:predicted nucleic acid-binding protein
MIPVVIDTNVFVAGLRSGGGASRAVLRRALGGGLQPLFGNALWMEYQDLLGILSGQLAYLCQWHRKQLAAPLAATGAI